MLCINIPIEDVYSATAQTPPIPALRLFASQWGSTPILSFSRFLARLIFLWWEFRPNRHQPVSYIPFGVSLSYGSL